MYMTHSSKMAWCSIKELSEDPIKEKNSTKVTSNQVAQQLLLSGKVKDSNIPPRLIRPPQTESQCLKAPLSPMELNEGMKNGKSTGTDDI